ncbi:MAG: hypothetical protein O3A96_15420, partial [Proteobacteria bacterium]|nr:hypothetical protein [Pseudomonadota bacterium]
LCPSWPPCLKIREEGVYESRGYSHWRGGDRRTVAQLWLDGCEPNGGDARRALEQLGCKIIEWQHGSNAAILLVANRGAPLHKLFAETRWANGRWRQALRYLEGSGPWPVRTNGTQVKINGLKQRATAIPAKHLPTPDEPPAQNTTAAGDATDRVGDQVAPGVAPGSGPR